MHCLICDEPISDQEVVRLRQGGVRFKRWGVEFSAFPFEDDEEEKYLHLACSREHSIMIPTLEEGFCTLCQMEFEPDEPGRPSDCVVQVDRGLLQPEGPHLMFYTQDHGNAHYMCACDEWNLPLDSSYGERM